MLEVRQLEKVVEDRGMLSIDQHEITAGEVVAVIGLAHSGKSTLIRLFSGGVLPSGGTIILDGQSATRSTAVRKRIDTLFEEDLLYERHTAQRNRIASRKIGSSWFFVKGMKVTSKMKLSPGIHLDVVIDQLGFSDDSPKTRRTVCTSVMIFLYNGEQ